MPITWGDTLLNVQGSERAPAPTNLTERKLVPDPSLPATTPQTTLSGTGVGRRRWTFECHGSDTDYGALETDQGAYTSRTLVTPEGASVTAMILELTPARKRPGYGSLVFFSVTFIEK